MTYFIGPMTDIKSILERDVLPFVEKPLRYVGSELNVVRKELAGVTLHGVFCFPDLYDIGMSHLGLQILYHIVNKEPSWALSRSFHPWADMEARMRELHLPLYSLEYLSPVRDADWIGFSVQYELHATNILNMLDLAGIPLYQRERTAGDPLVIAGGPCMGNPEPLADFFDACVVGDGEEAVVSLCRVMEKGKKTGADRKETLGALAGIKGVYVPSLYKTKKQGVFVVPDMGGAPPVEAAKVRTLRNEWYPERPLVPLIEVVHHRMAVEVMRGCTRGCRFCAAGMYYRPVRERDPGDIYREMERGIAATGWRDVGLLSLSTADYSCLGPLLASAGALKERYRVAISLPSTRIDALTPEQFGLLNSVSPVSSLTIAPEAGSARLRQVINKDFSDEAIYTTVETLLGRGVQTIKLYFMIGLPTERQEDIDALSAMVAKIAGMARAKSHRCRVNVSLSPFSPKPQTPFQWEAMDTPESLQQKSSMVKNRLGFLKNVKVSYRTVRMTLLETVLARGDRAMGAVVYNAWKSGSRFDGWDERFDFNRWQQAAVDAAVDFSVYTGEIPQGQELPWSAVSTGVSLEFLSRERVRAYDGQVTADCRKNDCALCGVCDGAARPLLAASGPIPPAGRADRLTQGIGTAGLAQKQYCHRCIYKKGMEIRFLGHLDMAAVFHRALISSGFALQYSQGFGPHPRVSFGPPLPFGVIGDAEAFDMITVAPVTGDPLRVNAMLPAGLQVLSMAALPQGMPSLSSSITAARYRFVPIGGMDGRALRDAVDAVNSQAAVPVTIVKNGETKTKDLRPLIRELLVDKNEQSAVQAVLSLEPGATCKPSELIMALFPGRRFTDFLVTRSECLVRKGGVLAGLRGEAGA
jgi:radical SAM family uncharacterized protein/radical SAM-linked protein